MSNADIVRRFFDAWEAKSLDGIMGLRTPDARWLNVGQPEPSTISPLRFSIRRCPMKHSLASRPRPLR